MNIANICAVVTGNHPIDIIIYGIQSRLQDNILQLYHSGSQLRHVLLFHECSFSATCIDLTIGACTSLRRHRAHIQRISKYKSFEFAQNGRLRTFTKATYFIALSATRNVNSFEVYSPSLEYAETWLCFQQVPHTTNSSCYYCRARSLSVSSLYA